MCKIAGNAAYNAVKLERFSTGLRASGLKSQHYKCPVIILIMLSGFPRHTQDPEGCKFEVMSHCVPANLAFWSSSKFSDVAVLCDIK